MKKPQVSDRVGRRVQLSRQKLQIECAPARQLQAADLLEYLPIIFWVSWLPGQLPLDEPDMFLVEVSKKADHIAIYPAAGRIISSVSLEAGGSSSTAGHLHLYDLSDITIEPNGQLQIRSRFHFKPVELGIEFWPSWEIDLDIYLFPRQSVQ